MGRKKIMVIDGNSLMHRAFYGVHLLSTRKGIYTNAIFGFINMLLRLLDEQQPHYISVAFDLKGPTFRHDIYEEYKGNRHKTPEELVPQFDYLKSLLKEMNIAIYEKEGYEADDILGTFSRIAEEEKINALLVTGDRDVLQLVSSYTTVFLTRKGISEVDVFVPEEVKKVYQVTPEQIIDLKALMGDISDNIPGVPGVGEKTALKLLHEYDTVEGVLEHYNEVSGKKLKENLYTYREQALLSKELATIVRDVPLNINLEDCCYELPRTPELKALLEELEFNSIINKLGFESSMHSEQSQAVGRKKEIINIETLKDLKKCVDKALEQERIAILAEENLSFAWGTDKVFQIPLRRTLLDNGLDYYEVLIALQPILTSEQTGKIIHDSKSFARNADEYNIEVKNVIFDTFIAAYLLDSTHTRYDLEYLLYEYLKLDISSTDASDLLLLANKISENLKEMGLETLYEQIEHPLIQVLADMERIGFKVDKDILRELDEESTKILAGLTEDIYEISGEKFNINSPKQLGGILFDKLGLPVIKKTKTGYSTDAEVLDQLEGQHDIIEKIIEYRHIMKLKSTYIDGLLNVIDSKDGRIHSSFNQAVTSTGRISSTDPNLQNIPIRMEMGRRIRKVFVASDENHVLVDADYSQIELRVLAHISQDPSFIDAFIQKQDIHRRTASQIFEVPLDEVTQEQRDSAKAVNFGIVYGISDFGLARNLGISRNQASEYIESYFKRYPGIKEYMDKIVHTGKEQGYVTTLMGRRRNLPELASRNYNIRSFGERIAMNTPIQGTAADIIKKAMNSVYYEMKNRKLKSKLILQVHDELIVDTYKPELEEVMELIKEKMENAMELSVPLVVDIEVGSSWYDTK